MLTRGIGFLMRKPNVWTLNNGPEHRKVLAGMEPKENKVEEKKTKIKKLLVVVKGIRP